MTTREIFASRALAGLLARSEGYPDMVAEANRAVGYADALIRALDQVKPAPAPDRLRI